VFDTAPILWLQAHGSHAFTKVMGAVSLAGYFPACGLVAVIVAATGRVRQGLALLLAIIVSAGITHAAKALVHSPRPYRVDAHVHALAPFAPLHKDEDDDDGTDHSGQHSFPSGHAAATATLGFGAWWIWRRRWLAASAGAWIAATAISRLYLGRHFLGDLLGGFAVGLASAAVIRLVPDVRSPASRTGPSRRRRS
jgi:membrane-associated phospholipid phosphatase